MFEDFMNALQNFRRNKTRTLLSLLGVIIGVASVIVGIELTDTQEVDNLGIHLFFGAGNTAYQLAVFFADHREFEVEADIRTGQTAGKIHDTVDLDGAKEGTTITVFAKGNQRSKSTVAKPVVVMMVDT